MTNPSFVNRVETLPPIGASDHDIVYSEINLALPQNKQQAHKVLNYKKAQWDQIEKDLTETYKQLKKDQDKMSLDELWNIFKTNVQETIHKYIPTNSIGNKSRLPWVNNQLKKLINKKNKELVVYFAAGLGLFHCKLYHDHSHRLVVMFLLY
jgi:hypothetical protein